jgi:hypothetical protein
MTEEEINEAILEHYRSRAKRDSEHGVIDKVIIEIVGRMADMDMPPQEIASILLPIDHPANSN